MSLAGGADEKEAEESFDLHRIEKHRFTVGAGDRHVSAFNVQLPSDKERQFPGHESPGGRFHFPVNPSGNKGRHASARLILHESLQPRRLNPNACRASEQPRTRFLGHTREPRRGRLPGPAVGDPQS